MKPGQIFVVTEVVKPSRDPRSPEVLFRLEMTGEYGNWPEKGDVLVPEPEEGVRLDRKTGLEG
jgi:hypothetical protein